MITALAFCGISLMLAIIALLIGQGLRDECKRLRRWGLEKQAEAERLWETVSLLMEDKRSLQSQLESSVTLDKVSDEDLSAELRVRALARLGKDGKPCSWCNEVIGKGELHYYGCPERAKELAHDHTTRTLSPPVLRPGPQNHSSRCLSANRFGDGFICEEDGCT